MSSSPRKMWSRPERPALRAGWRETPSHAETPEFWTPSDAPLSLREETGEWERPAGPVVACHGVWRHWGRGPRRQLVLRDIDLSIPRGTAACIRGGNGAGKTTLLRILTGILAPSAGSVVVDGIPVGKRWRDYHRRIGFLAAGDRGLYARVTVREHLEYCARLGFVPRLEREAALEGALRQFDLAALATRRADRLSQGQRQRLRLALSIVHRPTVLLLDEPRNSLDTEGVEILVAAVTGLIRDGGAAVWCAPAGEDQPMEFDREFLLADGGLIAQ